MRKSTSIVEEPLPTTHNAEGWCSCTCRSEIENRAISGNASENVAGRWVYREDIALQSILKMEILNMETFNYGE